MVYLVTSAWERRIFVLGDAASCRSGLVAFGSHTHTHRHFARRQLYQTWKKSSGSPKRSLKTVWVNRATICLAVGNYETDWLPMVERIGYRSGSDTLSGANAPGTDPYELRPSMSAARRPWLIFAPAWNGGRQPRALTDSYGLGPASKSLVE